MVGAPDDATVWSWPIPLVVAVVQSPFSLVMVEDSQSAEWVNTRRGAFEGMFAQASMVGSQ
ncbi:hypothetical protein D3C87_1985170 [compost metagenome]